MEVAIENNCINQVSASNDIEINAQDVRNMRMETIQNGGPIFLSIHYFNNKLGCSYFDASSSKIFLFSDIQEVTTDFKIIDKLFQQVEPNFVLTSNKCDYRLKNRIQNYFNSLDFNLNTFCSSL